MNPNHKSVMRRLAAVVVPAALLAFVIVAPAQAATPVETAAKAGGAAFSIEGLQQVRHDRNRSGKRGHRHSRGHPHSSRGHPGARGHKQSRRGHSRGRGPGHRSSRGAEHHHHYHGRSKRSGSRDRRDRRSSGSIHLNLPLPLPRL